MKKFMTLFLTLCTITLFAQSNTFPPSGNVGIGITSPKDLLHIRGNNPTLRLSSESYFGGHGGDINKILATIKFSNRDDNHTYRSEIKGLLTGNWASQVGLSFSTPKSGIQVERIRIKHDGNVGIGTKNPDEKLTVKGKIHAEEVRVDLAVPADYVFQKYYTGASALKADYVMPSLEEVAAFTKKNHHLPAMPSATQIQKEGLHLKQMTNLLLQKVEELTLYTIQQEKRIKALETQVKKTH